jgi:hypothetical protein
LSLGETANVRVRRGTDRCCGHLRIDHKWLDRPNCAGLMALTPMEAWLWIWEPFGGRNESLYVASSRERLSQAGTRSRDSVSAHCGAGAGSRYQQCENRFHCGRSR